MKINETINLFTIPYAGGSSLIYYPWKEEMSENIRLIPVELAGRGRRFREANYNTFEDAVEDVIKNISSQINELQRFIVFGHSMGGLIAYYVCLKLISEFNMMPEFLVISACKPPNIFNVNKRTENPTDEMIIMELEATGRVPKEIIVEKEFKEYIFPAIKNDFRLAREFKCNSDTIINCPSICLYGDNDSIKEDEIFGWGNFANEVEFIKYEGDHFFILNQYPSICKLIKSKISKEQ